MGILGISANLIFEIFSIYFPQLAGHKYLAVLIIAVVIIGIMYSLLLVGKYTFFEKILVIFVTIMGLSFIVSLFLVFPLPIDVIKGLVPSVPNVAGGKMMVAAFIGTTMAAATFLSRPLFVKGKGWTIANLTQQKKDSIIAAILIFFISGSVMAVACGALFHQGHPVNKGAPHGKYAGTNCRKVCPRAVLFWHSECRFIIHFPLLAYRPAADCRLPVGEAEHEFTAVSADYSGCINCGFDRPHI